MTATTAAKIPAAATTTAPRADLYAGIHKAMRHFMTDTLHRVGRVDVGDAADLQRTLAQVEALLAQCVRHVEHENEHMHTAIDARSPRGASRTADDHVEHLDSIDTLRAEVESLRRAAPAERSTLALRLYRHLALFVAENFQHMHVEETQNNATLWAHYSDAELLALHGRILASIPFDEHLLIARWMLPAMNPTERAEVAGGMKAQAPAEAFAAILDVVRPHLDDSAWDKLARAIGIAQQPGLVDVR